jgi:hypothetical protein
MKPLKLIYAFLFCSMLSSCSFECSVGNKKDDIKTKPISSADANELNGAVIKNEIEIEATGVKLKEAYLVDENNNLLKENKTGILQKIYLVLKADTGWVKENGKSYIGASERISTPDGRVIVDAADVFKEYETTGLPADKAETVSLSAIITKADPGLDHFTVNFKVWDKKGKGEIKGKYSFSLK